MTDQHILAGLGLLAMPICSVFQMRALRSGQRANQRIWLFVSGIIWMWLMIGGVVWVYPLDAVFFPHVPANLRPPWSLDLFFIPVCVYFAVSLSLPLFLLGSSGFRLKLKEAVEQRSMIHPQNGRERAYYAFMAVSVGIGEELFFRSFLTGYLLGEPFEFSWLSAVVAANFAFALVHFPQGWTAMAKAAVTGLLFSYLLMFTGNLFLPILLHVLLDLRILLIEKLARRWEGRSGDIRG